MGHGGYWAQAACPETGMESTTQSLVHQEHRQGAGERGRAMERKRWTRAPVQRLLEAGTLSLDSILGTMGNQPKILSNGVI